MKKVTTFLSAALVLGAAAISDSAASTAAAIPPKKCESCIPWWEEWETFFNHPINRIGSAYSASTMKETEKAYLISIDLPGMEKKDIAIETTGNRLSVSGERKEESEGKEGTKRSHTQFQQSYLLPDDANLEAISATSANGVLKITIPKTGKKSSRKIEIQ